MNEMKYTQFKHSVLLLIFLATASSAYVTVGIIGDGCDVDNLLDAYTSGDNEIRLTRQLTMHDNFVITRPLSIKGGYENCLDADDDIRGNDLSQWDGDNDDTVVEINLPSFAVDDRVTLDQMRIFNGNKISFAGAGGIFVHGNSHLLLKKSKVDHNTGNEGGGIRVRGANASVWIEDSKIAFNEADTGGGIYCEANALVNISGNSAINTNTASNKGGGVFANADCLVQSYSGSVASGFAVEYGIFANQAKYGGGVYLQAGADMQLIGNSIHPASIDFNISTNSNEQLTGGGGLYMTGVGTDFTGINAKIINNFANTSGGGIVVRDNAYFSMGRKTTFSGDVSCWDNEKCSELSNNTVLFANSGHAGAGYIDGNSFVAIHQTKIDGNKASKTAVFDIKGAFVELEGNIISNHKAQQIPITTESLFRLREYASLEIAYNTIANNDSTNTIVLYLKTAQELSILSSIIWDNGDIYAEVDNSGDSLPLAQNTTFDCLIAHEIQSFPNQTVTNISQANPQFLDSVNNNFHVPIFSDAVDFCNENNVQSQYNDLNGTPRGIDLQDRVNLLGPYDLGAYELNNDLIFANGFE